MDMAQLKIRIQGVGKLLLANAQAADQLNEFAIKKKIITDKTKKSVEDYQRLRLLDMESCLYYDQNIGVYVPGSWIREAIGSKSHAMCKVAKAEIRGAFYIDEKIPLKYKDANKIKHAQDIVRNPKFQQVILVKQKGDRVAKTFPVFHEWSFETELLFDPDVISKANVLRILHQVSRYGGYGNFRPGYGRAICSEVEEA